VKKRFIIILYFVVIFVSYKYLKPVVEETFAKSYYNYVDKKMVSNAPNIDNFILGFYKPELPFDYSKLQEIEDSLTVKNNIVSIYQAWGEGKEYQFNKKIIKAITKKGYIPMITWEPWLSEFKGYKNKKIEHQLRDISNGKFDWFIRDYAKQVIRFGKPMYIRFAHEMSNPWYSWSKQYGNSPKDYIEAWRKVVSIFREEGAKNVSFIWTPYTKFDDKYYPGDKFVDIIGFDIFNFGTSIVGGHWQNFYDVTKPMYDVYYKHNKPILISEVGTSSIGGDKGDWFAKMFETIASKRFSKINGIVIFDNPVWKDGNGLEIDWSLSSNKDIYKKIKHSFLKDYK